MDQLGVLMHEYQTITDQIAHWDSLFWRTSQIFLVIQSALLVLVGDRLTGQLGDGATMPISLFLLFLGVGLFNIVVNYIWYRANRRNRQYLRVRFTRARQIEGDPTMRDILKLYRLEDHELRQSPRWKHGSGRFETHLPTLCAFAWMALMFAAAVLDCGCPIQLLLRASIVGGLVALMAALIAVMEKTGWLVRSQRST